MKRMIRIIMAAWWVSGPAVSIAQPAWTATAPTLPQAPAARSGATPINDDVGVPVFPYDFPERRYTVLGEVKAGVRKGTIFAGEASQRKIYRELWERARRLGADAVINARYGDSHVSLTSWGKTNATGTAIRFDQ